VRSRWLDIGQVLFLRVYGPRLRLGPETRKKRTRPISNHLDRTNLVNKAFIIWLSRKFFMRDTAGSPDRARWLHLARSCSQSQRAIWFILPARGASHIISHAITYTNRRVTAGSYGSLSHAPQMSSFQKRHRILMFLVFQETKL